MKKSVVLVILFFAIACVCMTLASSSAPLSSINCEDTFGWMATSSTSPSDTACRSWQSTTDTVYGFAPVWDNVNKVGEFYLQSPPIRSHNDLIVGGGLGPEFQVSNLTLIEFQISYGLELRRDGLIIRASTDHGSNWTEVTNLGVVLSTPYPYTMSTSTGLEVPPLGLRGIKAYTGTMGRTRVRMDLRSSSLIGQSVIFELYFVSDTSTAVEGVHLYSFNYWNAPLSPPADVSGIADNSSYAVNYTLAEDPRINHTEVWDNGSSIGNLNSPLQVSGLTNGSSHAVEVKNFDAYGNVAGVSCSPSPLIPLCTGRPPRTLLLVSKLSGTDVKGSWIQQTAEVPCGSTVGPVDGYFICRSYNPNGPWGSPIASGDGTLLSFNDPGVLNDGNLYFYKVLSTKAGVSE